MEIFLFKKKKLEQILWIFFFEKTLSTYQAKMNVPLGFVSFACYIFWYLKLFLKYLDLYYRFQANMWYWWVEALTSIGSLRKEMKILFDEELNISMNWRSSSVEMIVIVHKILSFIFVWIEMRMLDDYEKSVEQSFGSFFFFFFFISFGRNTSNSA